MKNKKTEENLISAYVAQEEAGNVTQSPFTDAKVEAVSEPSYDVQPEQNAQYKSMAEIARENRTHGREGMPVTGNGSGLKYRDNIGWLKIDVQTLPTQGLFYSDDFEISIRAARGEEIKHWSTMNDQDVNQLSRVDDILNYMIEKCCMVKSSEHPGNCWKDLKNVDRFYLLLAIKEFTFLDGENELQVPVSEDKNVPVVKEMIDFVHFPETIMKYYDSTERCFIINKTGQPIKLYVPSLGVNEWLKRYVANKINVKEGYDEDFLTYAPMLIKDYRGLSQRAYEELVASTRLWGVKEWSILAQATKLLGGSTEPKLKYIDDNGAEVEVPLTFRGGIRSIFVLSDIL